MLIVVMGVTGSGKSTLAAHIARRLNLAFFDADDFHPPENKAKMAANRPLDDADRQPWLERLAEASVGWEAQGGAVLACSALKQRYRDVLASRVTQARFVYLKLEREVVARRLEARRGEHAFIGAFDQVLAGQYRDLEEPAQAIVLTEQLPVEELSERVFAKLRREGFVGASPLLFERGGVDARLVEKDADELVDAVLAQSGKLGRVLLIPPDFTRFHSGAGDLTSRLYVRLHRQAEVSVLPALGTHAPMSLPQIERMFPGIPPSAFLVHEWRSGLTTLGEVPASFVHHASGGRIAYPIRCELDTAVAEGGWDRIFSVGQLVPHEVIGIAGHDKNVFVGTGGKDVIDRTHFLGAVCGMESIMGRAHTPVRDVLTYMAGQFARHLPITHLLTVREREASGALTTRGLFAGSGPGCFEAGAPLVQACNLLQLERPLPKVVVYLDPEEFHSTWLGNKAVYRTRMALADAGELVVLAPGVHRFGEDPGIDRLIRRHGYRGTPATLAALEQDPDLADSLSAAAHLIHGSSEGRFRITYATGGLSRSEVEGVGYEYTELAGALERYDPAQLRDGFNRLPDGEEIFFVHNPALGLWGLREQFQAGA